MLQYFIKFRFILSMLCISIRFNSLLSKSILLCYTERYEIDCVSDDQYIVIKDAVFGYLPSYKKPSDNQNKWCTISDSYKKLQLSDCRVSLMRKISDMCSGIKSCTLDAVYSQYLHKNSLSCPEIAVNHEILTLYVNYECVPKDLLRSADNLKDFNLIGGYITSVGYISQKSNDHDDYKYTAEYFREKNFLPIKTTFRPATHSEKLTVSPIVFQFQILENTLYSYQTNSNINTTTNPCQMGKLYFQDYYAFIPSNKSSHEHSIDKSVIICRSSRDLVGERLEPIIADQINISINVNFTLTLNTKRGLLIKFTTIFCPHLSIENADVSYDDNVIDKTRVEVIGFAKIDCKPGYFLYPSLNSSQDNNNNNTSNIRRTVSVNCDHEKGLWEPALQSVKCVNNLPTQSPITTAHAGTSLQSISTTTKKFLLISSASPSSTMPMSTNDSMVPIIIPTTITTIWAQENILIKYILPCLSILLLVPCIFGYILFKKKGKLKCISLDCAAFPKIFSKKKNDFKLHCHNNYNHNYRDSGEYRLVRDCMTPISGSLGFIGFSPNGSCRQSNRTLTTRVDSKPTIGSRDSFPLSNNMSDFEINQLHTGDELPSKVPKQSPMMRMLRSASSLRNHSLGTFRPMSLSKQSFDRSSNISDDRFSSSQAVLLKGWRNNINSEFIEMNPTMWTSDITPSKTNPNHFNNHSHSDIFSKFNQKVYSPTIDTYLEPTVEVSNQLDEEDSSQLSPLNQRKKSEDYMIYDPSRISSNNVDSTWPSSVHESSSDLNHNENEENKRFSMISNKYYGQLGPDMKPKYDPLKTSNSIHEANHSNDNIQISDESVYESIDDDPMYQSTLERRKMALPLPPNDD